MRLCMPLSSRASVLRETVNIYACMHKCVSVMTAALKDDPKGCPPPGRKSHPFVRVREKVAALKHGTTEDRPRVHEIGGTQCRFLEQRQYTNR